MNNFDFSKEPGKELNIIKYTTKTKPVVSIVTPFYNDKKYIRQSVYSILNQTYPNFELLIIDDGSQDKESLEELKKVEKLDDRIKVFHKENEGLAATRDYGATKVNKNSKYLLFIDSDDLLTPTFLETALWTLETNPEASWAYSDSIGFDEQQYLWNKWFNPNKMKKVNDLVNTALVRKEAYNDVGGYGIREKAVNEDWNYWLKLIGKERFPVRMSYYGLWYRRKPKKESELARSQSKENHKKSMAIINETAKKIGKTKQAKQYPKFDYNWDRIVEKFDGIEVPKEEKNNKINLLFFIPWMTVGGADQFNLDFISGLDPKKFTITIISTEPQINKIRQACEDYATVYDLSTFLDCKYWLAFINYIIEKRNINIVMNSNSELGYNILPYIKARNPEIPMIDYIHMEEWYNRNGGYSRDSSSISSILDKTLTCNARSQKILQDHFERAPEDTETVYIGVDEKQYDPKKYDAKECKEKYDLPDDKFIIGFVCRIANQKRPLLLVEIAKKLKEKRNDFIFLIAGDGDMLPDMKATVSSYGLNSNFKFIGEIKDTREFYMACDLTINCSIKEGLALTSYESLAMGIPVISADVGGQKELINEDVGVIVPCIQKEEEINNFKYSDEEIVPYVDGIIKIIDKLDSYKAKCRKRVLGDFTLDIMKKRMSNIIEEVCKNPDPKKIEAGKGLSNNIPITIELYSRTLNTMKEKMLWLIEQYNNYYGFNSRYKFQLFKERMWKHPIYRVFIRILQKLGIMKAIKKRVDTE